MRRRSVLVLLAGAAFASPPLAVAQKPARVPRIAILMGGTPAAEAQRLAAFREGLERLGYVGGLLGYGPDLIENRLAAGYVDKLLRGATPADLAGAAADQVRAGD